MEVEPPPPPQASKLDAMDTADDADASAGATTHRASASSSAETEGDLYTRLKTLQRQLEFYEIQVRWRWVEEEGRERRERSNERERERETGGRNRKGGGGIEARCARGRRALFNLDLSRPLQKKKKKKKRRLNRTPQEEYIREEQRSLKRELLRAQEEVKRIQSVPLVIGQFLEMIDSDSGIVGSTTGSNYHVRVLSTINRELLRPSASVALHRHSNALVDGE